MKEENLYLFDNEFLDNDLNPNNSLKNNIDGISLKNPTISNIPKLKSLTSDMITVKVIKEEKKNINNIYPNKDEIPLLKIKDENFLESGEAISNYINSLTIFDNSKFDKCAICKENRNNYFCKNCYKNICDICYENCWFNFHILIDLSEKKNKIINYIKDIKAIFEVYFILSGNKKENDDIIKQNNNYEFINEYEMNNEIEEKPMDYTNDIILIEAIIEKNYINYFHYKNVQKCFNYVKKNTI